MSERKTTTPNGRMRESARRFAVWTLVMLIGRAACALTPLNSIRYTPDITVVLGGTTVSPQNVAEDNLAGTVSLVNIGTVPSGTDVIAYDHLANGDQLLAFDVDTTLAGGLTVRPGDVVRFNGTTYALEFDATANGIALGVMTDAISEIGPNDLLLSFDVTVTLGSITAAPEDLVRFKDGAFSLFFDGSVVGVPVGLNLDAVHCLPRNGHLLLSFDGSGNVGGVDFDDEDVLEYSPASNTWAMAYDGSVQHAEWPPADLVGLAASPATPPNSIAPVIGGGLPGPGGVGGQGGLPEGTTRVFGFGTPNAKPGDSCIEILLVGSNNVPDAPPGSVDDQLIGTGGTDAAGNFVDGSDVPGIALTRPLGAGERLFAFDACNDLVGATVSVRASAPALSPMVLMLVAGMLALVGSLRLSRRPDLRAVIS